MIAIVLVLLASDSSTLEALGRGSSESRRFTIVGTVANSGSFSSERIPGIPITLDPRFVIRVRVDKVVSGTAPWKVGSEQVFLVHSPAKMFGSYDPKDERFRFTFEVGPAARSERECKYCLIELAGDGPEKP